MRGVAAYAPGWGVRRKRRIPGSGGGNGDPVILSTGPVNGSTFQNTVHLAAGLGSWSSPGNAAASDNVYTVCEIEGWDEPEARTSTLTVRGFDFSDVPDDATVTGIKVSIERHADIEGACVDRFLRLYVGSGGAQLAGELKEPLTSIPTSDAVAEFGGETDAWGLELTGSDLTVEGFNLLGVAYVANAPMFPSFEYVYVSVDHVSMTVFYTEG